MHDNTTSLMDLLIVTRKLSAGLIKNAKDCDEWLIRQSDNELERWMDAIEIVKEDEDVAVMLLELSLGLYAREIDVFDFDANTDLCKLVLGRLITNIMLEYGRRKGMYEISHPYALYKAEGTVKKLK